MIVFVLTEGYDHEGEHFISVYSTRERAFEARRQAANKDTIADWRSVHKVVIDDPPRNYFYGHGEEESDERSP